MAGGRRGARPRALPPPHRRRGRHGRHRKLPRRARRDAGRRAIPAARAAGRPTPGAASPMPARPRGSSPPGITTSRCSTSPSTPRCGSPPTGPVGMTVHHVTGPTARERWGPVVGSAIAGRSAGVLRRGRWFTATSRGHRGASAAAGPPRRRRSASCRRACRTSSSACRARRGRLPPLFRAAGLVPEGAGHAPGGDRAAGARAPGLELRIAGRGKDARAGLGRGARGLGIGGLTSGSSERSSGRSERRELLAPAPGSS